MLVWHGLRLDSLPALEHTLCGKYVLYKRFATNKFEHVPAENWVS